MNYPKLFVPALIAVVVLAGLIGSIAIADQAGDSKTAPQPEMKLPPGWTQADMQACMAAGTPGKQHEYLAKGLGVWQGKSSMWMAPGTDPVTSESTATNTSLMDGHYIKSEVAGDMPGMGPFSGLGIYGFDNVSQKFVCSWIDNHSTGIMTGTGELSPDEKTLTWTYTFNCPVTGKPTVMRETHTITGPNTRTIEIIGPDPKSGKEFKMMSIELTKKS